MTCEHCQTALTQPHSGSCDFACVGCCARLVVSARPSRNLQDGMFAAIAWAPKAPTREEILEYMKLNYSAPRPAVKSLK